MSGGIDRLSALAPFSRRNGGGVFEPRSIEELAILVRAVREEGMAIELRGSGAGPSWARRDLPPSVAIRMNGIATAIEIAPLDLVMTVDAGVSLDRARAAARESGLDLALEDPPWTPCTIGGLLARGEGRGSQCLPAGPRGVVLGIDAVLPDGRPVHCGGRVVKNVAGYDTHRLFVGSLGTLGAIARVHMKLVPHPGVEEGWVRESTLDSALDGADAILRRLPPVASLAVDCALGGTPLPEGAGEGVSVSPARLRVRICASRARASLLRDRLRAEVPGLHPVEDGERPLGSIDRPVTEDPDRAVDMSRRDPFPRESAAGIGLASLIRATVPRSGIRPILRKWDASLIAGSRAARARIHPDAGEVWLRLDAPAEVGLCAALAEACRPHGRLLEAWRPVDTGRPAWDPAPAMLPFWVALRERLDPDHLWNPGILPVRNAG